MRIRLIGKFVAWIFRGIFSRIIGSRSFIGAYFALCKEKFQNKEPEIIMIVVVCPLVAALIVTALCAAFGMPERAALQAGVESFYANTVWNIAVFINVLWDKFIREYEQSFTILKEHE